MHRVIKSTVITLLLYCTLFSTTVVASKVGGVELAESASVGAHKLTLNGAGIRKKFFIKLYVGSLYLVAASTDAKAIISADEPMLISLNILSDFLTRDKMVKALVDGFEKSTSGNTVPIQAEIDQMITLLQAKIEPGDIYSLAYEPGVGTRIERNGTELSVIAGLPFKQALFGIWLSEKPAQASLKRAMLGH